VTGILFTLRCVESTGTFLRARFFAFPERQQDPYPANITGAVEIIWVGYVVSLT